MPLLDHFRPPLADRRHWHSFHNAWATYISSRLNELLPAGWFAEPNVQFGVEVDVAAFSEDGERRPADFPTWTPPAPGGSIPVALSDALVEVSVFRRGGGPELAAVVEIISPANKDRPAQREALVSKCAAHLQSGVGLVLVDVVTGRRADLHGDLLARVSGGPAREAVPLTDSKSETAGLFSASYRPVMREGATVLDWWREALSLGMELPTMPLWLPGGMCLPLELGATYARTCREQRIAPAA